MKPEQSTYAIAFEINTGLVGPFFLAKNMTQSAALIGSTFNIGTLENNGRTLFFLHQKVMTFKETDRKNNRPSQQATILADPAVDTERCISAAIPGLALDSSMESINSDKYTFP